MRDDPRAYLSEHLGNPGAVLVVGEPPRANLFARMAEAALAGVSPLANNGDKIPLTGR